MKIVDANVLLYAVNADSPQHEPARRWLDGALSGGEMVGFDWVVLLAFLRIATHPSIFPSPLTVDAAFDAMDVWLSSANARLLVPTQRHAEMLRNVIDDVGVGGNLVTDAHIAALAREHQAPVVSFDRDFDRFSGVQRIEP